MLLCSCLHANVPETKALLTGNFAGKTKRQRSFFMVDQEQKVRRIFYQSSAGFSGSIISQGLIGSDIESFNYGIYWAPRVIYRINNISSVCIGSDIQLSINSNETFSTLLPFTIGFSVGNGSTKKCRMPAGAFINFGIATNSLMEGKSISGPFVDAGFRVKGFELRFFGLESADVKDKSFLLGMALGYWYR